MPNLSDSTIWSLRQEAATAGDGDLSRLCSLALWGTTPRQRSDARRKLAKQVAQ